MSSDSETEDILGEELSSDSDSDSTQVGNSFEEVHWDKIGELQDGTEVFECDNKKCQTNCLFRVENFKRHIVWHKKQYEKKQRRLGMGSRNEEEQASSTSLERKISPRHAPKRKVFTCPVDGTPFHSKRLLERHLEVLTSKKRVPSRNADEGPELNKNIKKK